MSKRYKLLISMAILLVTHAVAQADEYEVTVTNLTRGQIFSPLFAFTHSGNAKLFTRGQQASSELAAFAEDADSSGLNTLYSSSSEVADIVQGADVIMPGKSETFMIKDQGRKRFISLASMLVTSNDAFLALNRIKLPYRSRRLTVPAYDAGSENNDESCAYIPGPPCGNPNASSDQPGEGFVHIHSGIHGGADLSAAQFDWNNPVAEIFIKRVKPKLYKY